MSMSPAPRTRQRMERLVSGSRWVDSGHVFTTLHGTPHHAATITRAFQAALERAGLPHCRFHDLRHAAATFLLAQGMTLEDVKNRFGHSSITLTSNTYGHVLEQRQVARAMDAVLGGRGPWRAPRAAEVAQRDRSVAAASPAWGQAPARLLPARQPTRERAADRGAHAECREQAEQRPRERDGEAHRFHNWPLTIGMPPGPRAASVRYVAMNAASSFHRSSTTRRGASW